MVEDKVPFRGDSIYKYHECKKSKLIFSARASGGPKRPTTPPYGAAGENFRGKEEMVYDIDINTTPSTPRKPSPAELKKVRSHSQI